MLFRTTINNCVYIGGVFKIAIYNTTFVYQTEVDITMSPPKIVSLYLNHQPQVSQALSNKNAACNIISEPHM